MPGYGDPGGGYPPSPFDATPDLASLQYPWSNPQPPVLQPGIGVPTAALDAALPPTELGPPPADAASVPTGNPFTSQPLEPEPPPAPPASPTGRVADFPGIDISTEPPPMPGPPPALPGEPPPGVAGPPISPAEQHYRQAVDQYGNPLDIPDEGERARRLNELDPYQLAEVNAHDKERRDAFIVQRRKEYADADAEAARQHMESWKAANEATQAKMDETLADAQRLADTKIDPSGGVHGGRLLAGVIASIIGGLVQGRTGSARNAGLDALESTINRGIEAQKAQLANKRGAIDLKRNVLAAEFARHGDMYQAEEAVRLASWRHIDDTLAFEQQNYDPRGRTALLIANQRRQIGAAMAQADEARRQKFLENNLKVQDAARQQQLADETLRHNRATVGLGYAQLNSAAADRAAARDARTADKATERADKATERERQFAIGGVPRVQTGPDGKPVIGPDGKPVITNDILRNADGSAWEAESPEATRELRQKKSSATEVISIIDEIRGIRDRVGGESKLLNSDDAQRLEVLQARAKLLTKAGTQGMSSDKDMETLSDAAGTSNATSWRSQEARLVEARSRTESALNVAFHDAKYSGPAITYPQARAAKNTPAEDEVQSLLQRPQTSLDDEVNQEIDRRTLGLPPDQQRAFGGRLPTRDSNEAQLGLTPQQQAVYDDVLKSYDPTASSDQRRKIAELGAAAAGSGESATDASAKLQRIAAEAQTTHLRALAGRTLEEARQASLPGEPATQSTTRAVSYESLPPAAGKGRR